MNNNTDALIWYISHGYVPTNDEINVAFSENNEKILQYLIKDKKHIPTFDNFISLINLVSTYDNVQHISESLKLMVNTLRGTE